jgi:hypothetical protein
MPHSLNASAQVWQLKSEAEAEFTFGVDGMAAIDPFDDPWTCCAMVKVARAAAAAAKRWASILSSEWMVRYHDLMATSTKGVERGISDIRDVDAQSHADVW